MHACNSTMEMETEGSGLQGLQLQRESEASIGCMRVLSQTDGEMNRLVSRNTVPSILGSLSLGLRRTSCRDGNDPVGAYVEPQANPQQGPEAKRN